MSETLILAAIGCGRLPGILKTAEEKSFAVFGTMDNKNLSDFIESGNSLTGMPVYFYETG